MPDARNARSARCATFRTRFARAAMPGDHIMRTVPVHSLRMAASQLVLSRGVEGLCGDDHGVRQFTDRVDAGRRLAESLRPLPRADLVVLGLPRGGVVVANEVATTFGVPLDVVLVRKLGVPSQPELAMGAIGEDGVRVVNDQVMRALGVSAAQLED